MMTMRMTKNLPIVKKKNQSSQQMGRKMPTWVGYRSLGLQSPSRYMELAIFCSEVQEHGQIQSVASEVWCQLEEK